MALSLARKYRPKKFSDVAVQSHVSATLQGAIARNRVAHGYLFCGPRGTGKTTLARVLAMALNCENEAVRKTGEPCGACESCRRIWSGSASLDVVEIDAASNRGVDDARDLRERAMYAPSGDDRYKVYIVDEAHMLTREAWNALLKILEEPPPRVVFVFATTEPQKITQTAAPVMSRLQRFDLRRIGSPEIRARLSEVLSAEGVKADADALAQIARAADGSMRDALSLTDQVLSLGDGSVTPERVRDALGLVPEDEYLELLRLVSEHRAADVFPFVARLAEAGVDFSTFLAGFGEMVRAQLAIVLGGVATDVSERGREALTKGASRFAAADLVRMLTALTELEPRFRRSGQQQLLVETLLVRLALLDKTVQIEALLRGLGSGGTASTGGTPRPEPRHEFREPTPVPRSSAPASAPMADARPSGASRGPVESFTEPVRPVQSSAQPAPAVSPARDLSGLPPLDLNALTGKWDALVERLRQSGKALIASALEHASPTVVTGRGDLTVSLDEPNDFFAKAIQNGAPDILAVLREWFAPVERVVLAGARPASAPATPPKRLTDEMVKAEKLEALKRKDPLLAAAIDALDLEVID